MKRLLLLAAVLAAACGGSDDKNPNCDPAAPDACAEGLVCEVVQGVGTRCAAPVTITGTVFELSLGLDAGPIEGARVVPLDVNGAPVGTAATTDASGAYSLQVPAVRDANLEPIGHVTLRADASGYATFPSGIRSAVPLDLSAAVATGSPATGWTVASSLTDLGLEATAGAGTGRIHGNAAQATAGALVVAQSADGLTVRTGVADSTGAYVVFNVPAGDWTVQGYAQGVNYQAVTAAALAAGEDRQVDLAVKNRATATVTGSIQPTGQNQPAALDTSVILVVTATYDVELDRGESPPGLIVPDLTQSSFSLAGVPDGEYTVLAAFGTDGYIRDVSGIGGTAPVEVQVVNGVMTSSPGSFKITGAVSLAAEAIAPSTGTLGETLVTASATPTFDWVDYPSAVGGYDVVVFDSLGTPVWTPARLDAAVTSATYAGAALEPGRTYQVRVTAYDNAGLAVSRTEDLLGVFTFVPPPVP